VLPLQLCCTTTSTLCSWRRPHRRPSHCSTHPSHCSTAVCMSDCDVLPLSAVGVTPRVALQDILKRLVESFPVNPKDPKDQRIKKLRSCREVQPCQPRAGRLVCSEQYGLHPMARQSQLRGAMSVSSVAMVGSERASEHTVRLRSCVCYR